MASQQFSSSLLSFLQETYFILYLLSHRCAECPLCPAFVLSSSTTIIAVMPVFAQSITEFCFLFKSITRWHDVYILAAEALMLLYIAEAIYVRCLGFCWSNLCHVFLDHHLSLAFVLEVSSHEMPLRCFLGVGHKVIVPVTFVEGLTKSPSLWNKRRLYLQAGGFQSFRLNFIWLLFQVNPIQHVRIEGFWLSDIVAQDWNITPVFCSLWVQFILVLLLQTSLNSMIGS